MKTIRVRGVKLNGPDIVLSSQPNETRLRRSIQAYNRRHPGMHLPLNFRGRPLNRRQLQYVMDKYQVRLI